MAGLLAALSDVQRTTRGRCCCEKLGLLVLVLQVLRQGASSGGRTARSFGRWAALGAVTGARTRKPELGRRWSFLCGREALAGERARGDKRAGQTVGSER